MSATPFAGAIRGEFDDALTVGQSLTAPRKMAKESEVSLHFRELAAMLLAAAQLHVGIRPVGAPPRVALSDAA